MFVFLKIKKIKEKIKNRNNASKEDMLAQKIFIFHTCIVNKSYLKQFNLNYYSILIWFYFLKIKHKIYKKKTKIFIFFGCWHPMSVFCHYFKNILAMLSGIEAIGIPRIFKTLTVQQKIKILKLIWVIAM